LLSLSFFYAFFLSKQGEKQGVKAMNENLIGKRFGYLTVISLNSKDKRGSSWLCRCDCGNEIILGTTRLIGTEKRKPNRSCGCKARKRNGNSVKHSRLYQAWTSMLYRCYKPTHVSYERYGAKGVTVCEEWRESFDSFLEWALGNGYTDTLTLDRIDSTKPYSPDNCRWADYFTQAVNKGMRKNNKTGYKGVCKGQRSKYRAFLTRKGKSIYLGSFDNPIDGAMAREKALREYELTGTL
jgi:hypothetical protein